MPKIPPESRGNGSKYPFPRSSTGQKGQIKPHPQLSQAEGEGAVEPGRQQLQRDEKLAEPGAFAVEGPEHIRRRPQQHPHQKTAQEPLPDHLRSHRRHPRRNLGSS